MVFGMQIDDDNPTKIFKSGSSIFFLMSSVYKGEMVMIICHHFYTDIVRDNNNKICITLFDICSFHRYHLGTIAFGSLILAVIKIIRYFIDYIQVRLKGTTNQFARYTLKCLKCLFCFRFLKFLNKNAYIEVRWFHVHIQVPLTAK